MTLLSQSVYFRCIFKENFCKNFWIFKIGQNLPFFNPYLDNDCSKNAKNKNICKPNFKAFLMIPKYVFKT